MVVIEPLDSRGATKGKRGKPGVNMLDYLYEGQEQQPGYLLDGTEQNTSAWRGDLAKALGIEGQPVDRTTLWKHAQGYMGNGLNDVPNAGVLDDVTGPDGKVTTPAHKVGHAMVLSNGKDFSLAYAASSEHVRARMLNASDKGVSEAMDLIRRYTESRIGNQPVETRGLLYTTHQHWTARPVLGKTAKTPDANAPETPIAGMNNVYGEHQANLHVHIMLLNAALADDGTPQGKVTALNDRDLYNRNLQYAADMVYKATTARELMDLFRYEKVIERDALGNETGQIDYRIVGFSQMALDLSSDRQAEALKRAADKGMKVSDAFYQTRASKDNEPAYEELIAPGGLWERQIGALVAHGRMVAPDDLLRQSAHIGLGPRHDDTILENLHKRFGINFSRVDMLGELAKEHGPLFPATAQAQEALIDQFMQRNNLERYAAIEKAGLLTYSSGLYVGQEQAFMQSVRDRATDARTALTGDIEGYLAAYEAKKSAEMVRKNGPDAEPIKMSDEQKAAARMLAGPGGTVVLRGWAGTGKSFSIGAMTDAWKAEGREVYGLGQAWTAATMLESESGVKGLSVASFLAKLEMGTIEMAQGAVVLVDEGGTLDVLTGRKLQAAVDAVGGKFVLMGDDEHQQQAIGVGGAQNAAVRAGAPVTEMTNINRQRAGLVVGQDANGKDIRSHKAISNLLYAKKGQAAVDALKAEGMIEVVDKGYRAEIETLARRYVDAAKIDWKTGETVIRDGKPVPLGLHQKVMLAGENADADALNQAVRDLRQQRGEVGADFTVLAYKHNNKMGRQQQVLGGGDLLRLGSVTKEYIENDRARKAIKDQRATNRNAYENANVTFKRKIKAAEAAGNPTKAAKIEAKRLAAEKAFQDRDVRLHEQQFRHTSEEIEKHRRQQQYFDKQIAEARKSPDETIEVKSKGVKTGIRKSLAQLLAERDADALKFRLSELGVQNGTKAEIVGWLDDPKHPGDKILTLRILSDLPDDTNARGDRRLVDVRTCDYQHFQLGYAGTNFSAQGQSKEAAFVYAAGMNDHQKLVPALTRHKDRMTIVGNEEDIGSLVKAIEKDNLKLLAEDVLRDKTVLNAGTQQRLADQAAAAQAKRDEVAAHAEATLATFNLRVRATAHDARRDVIAAMADEHAKRAGDSNTLSAVASAGDSQALNAAIRERLRQDGRIRGADVTLTVTRGAMIDGSTFTPEADVQSRGAERYYRGTLEETGRRLYDPADPKSMSPYALIRGRDGQTHYVHGVDVPSAIERAGLAIGATVELRKGGGEAVQVTDPEHPGQTMLTTRNGWTATAHDFAKHDAVQREAFDRDTAQRAEALNAKTKTLSLDVAEGDVLAFNSPKAAAVTHGLTDPASVRLAVLNVKGGEQPEIHARVIGANEKHPDHGKDIVLTNGAGVEHAHAMPLFKAEQLAAGKTVQVMAAEDGRIKLDDLRKVQAAADAVVLRGTGQAFSATGTTIGQTLHNRTDTTERAQAALHSVTDRGDRAPVAVVHAERKPEALKALGQAYVESQQHDRNKIATAGNVADVRQVNNAVRDALREANLLGAQDVVANPTSKSPLALADGERLVLRSEKGASSFNLKERLEEPAQATYRVRGLETDRDKGVSAVLEVESTNAKDDGRMFTVNDRALAYMTHAYATTHDKAAALNRTEVLAYVTEKDKPQAVSNVLTNPAHGAVYGTTTNVQTFTGKIDGAQRVAAQALDRAASLQNREGIERDQRLQQAEQQKQHAVEQARAAEHAQKVQAEAQATARREADLKAVAEAVAEKRQAVEREKQQAQQRGRVHEIEHPAQQQQRRGRGISM
ncbi:AAA family ATPase [Burkholderia sp. Ax-1724]|uniref:AAA family ATPase n=1 Tax=Burkholderia sp. Ax-1724 TaxID=2608336 RepID=UPI0014214489|nr:AAA family ATPase [Burkholderia sp. Ax-1724]NIF54989.1 AAA family ATPase [Burkholderia sp. Ax-1724]